MKADSAEILMSSTFTDSDALGVFENSLRLTNYENTMKQEPEEDDKKDKKDEEADPDGNDPRAKRVKKAVSEIVLKSENDGTFKSDEYKF